MMVTSRWIAAALVALSLVAAGCSDSSTPASDAGASTDTGVTADTGAPADGGSNCTVNDDCRAYALHCDTCSCVALPTGTVDPVCNGQPVSCLVDPCLGKSPICAGGVCSLE